MSELLRELQEDMQRERYAVLWTRFGKILIAVCVTIVVATAANVIYKHWRDDRGREVTHTLLSGIEEGKAGTMQLEHVIENGPLGLRAIATLYAAKPLIVADKESEAASKLAAFADSDKSEPYVALSMLHGTRLLNKAPSQALEEGPFAASAKELAAWQLVDQGKTDEAVAIFKALATDAEAPATLRERAQLVLAYYAPDAMIPAPEVADEAEDVSATIKEAGDEEE